MTYEELIAEVQRRGGLESAEEAERALRVTTRVLGARLMPDEAGPIAAVLPEPIAMRVRDAAYERDFDVDELFDRVARGEGSGRHFGKEHAQAVCQIIGEALSDAARMRLQRHLGPTYAPLFEPRGPLSRPSRPLRFSRMVEPGRGTTLATGRPGASSPVSANKR